jgi:hypothetical protein
MLGTHNLATAHENSKKKETIALTKENASSFGSPATHSFSGRALFPMLLGRGSDWSDPAMVGYYWYYGRWMGMVHVTFAVF